MTEKVNGYLLIKFMNHKFLVKVRPFTAAKTINIYDHLKPILRDLNPSLFIIFVGTY